MEEFYLPTLHWFAMKNPFTGSSGNFRYKIQPNVVMATAKEVDFDASSIHAEFWHGPFCYDKSEMEGSNDFPMTEEGRETMKAWLVEHI